MSATTDQPTTTDLVRKNYKVVETLGVDDNGKGIEIPGFEPGHPRVPRAKSTYVFNKDHVRIIRAWLHEGGSDGLMLAGPMGSGKSSVINQLAARTGWPVYDITGSTRMEFADLVGHHTLVKGEMTYVHGPLALAAANGGLFVLNEADRIDPGELAGLHGVLDGEPLTIPENGGEVIPLHPEFRVVLTCNSNGQGDDTGLYQGVVAQDAAFLDRFWVLSVDYPEPATEKQILASQLPQLPEQLRDKMVDVANEVRRVFTGGADTGTDLSVTMSTRTLIRWGRMLMQFRNAPNALDYTLTTALLNRASAGEAEAIRRIAEAQFGYLWNTQGAQSGKANGKRGS